MVYKRFSYVCLDVAVVCTCVSFTDIFFSFHTNALYTTRKSVFHYVNTDKCRNTSRRMQVNLKVKYLTMDFLMN
jgi:hypothetical protein